jgi:phosphonate transport system substrate-binding protein
VDSLRFTSSQAPNASATVQAILAHLNQRLDIPIKFVEEGDWLAREAALDSGDIQLGWICGLPYVWKADAPKPSIRLLAAPVMAAARYGGRPIYFSDVIVHADSSFQRFNDLRGAIWAYNEPRSHSGPNITRYHLATLNETQGFFGQAIEAGSHERALKLLLRRRIDATAVDSTVLETELRAHPELADQMRVIATLGPSPIPPWVVHSSVPDELRAALQEALSNLHTYAEGRALLAAGALARFTLVDDADYDPIREMARLAESVQL